MRSIWFVSDGYFWGMLAWLAAGVVALVVLVRLRRATLTVSRRRWVHVSLSLWMVAAVFTGVELYYALIYDTTDSFSMTNVSKKWFEMHVRPFERELRFSREKGILFRDDHDMPRALPEGQQHVVFVGDSFTFGHGVRRTSDRFTNRLARSLEVEFPDRYTVTNLSNTGIDLDWIHRLLIELFEKRYPVDRIVYVVCLNDIETFHPRHRTYYEDLGKHAPTFFLFRDTYFFNLLYFRLRQFAVPDVQNYYQFVQEYYEGPPWERMAARLDQVHALCRDHDAQLEIVVFPFLHNLGPGYPFADAHQRFVEFGASRRLPVLDLTDHLRPHVDEGLTISRFDAHPNERAHELAAEALQRELFPGGQRGDSPP